MFLVNHEFRYLVKKTKLPKYLEITFGKPIAPKTKYILIELMISSLYIMCVFYTIIDNSIAGVTVKCIYIYIPIIIMLRAWQF